MSDLKTLQARAAQIRDGYAKLNQQQRRDTWGPKEFSLGFVGDVGDLAKLVMAKENLRTIENADAKLAHELSDCLWSLLVLADHYNISLETEFVKTMDELETRITEAA